MGDGCLSNEHFEELGGILKGKLEEHFKNQEARQGEELLEDVYCIKIQYKLWKFLNTAVFLVLKKHFWLSMLNCCAAKDFCWNSLITFFWFIVSSKEQWIFWTRIFTVTFDQFSASLI